MRVAMIEYDAVWEDEAANRARLPGRMPAPGEADVAVLPEMTFSGFSIDAAPDPAAEPFLVDLARGRATALVAGYVAPGPANAALAVARDGRVLGRCAKLHPFTFAGEHRRFRAGSDLPLFELGGARCAALICYDLRFPEAFREAARRGAEVFFVIANWPARRVDHWRTLLAARAIENQAFVVGVNRTGSDPHEAYVSSSLAVGPRGEVLHEGAGIVAIDVGQARRWRQEFPALADARPDRCRFDDPGPHDS